jgi:hypothetical protein
MLVAATTVFLYYTIWTLFMVWHFPYTIFRSMLYDRAVWRINRVSNNSTALR